MAAIAVGVGMMVMCSSSSVAAMMMSGDADADADAGAGAGAGTPAPPTAPTPVLRDTPETMRHASTVWSGQAIGVGHGLGRLDSVQGWSAQTSAIGEWYQMDNGVVGKIAGVAIKGRREAVHDQWVKTFKVQSKGATGTWTDVDSGKVYTGNTDRETQVDVTFDTPVDARYIRIYPQTWNNHMSMRTDIVAGKTRTDKIPTIVDVPYSGHKSSSNYADNAIGTSHGTGRLDSDQAWSAKTNAIGQWYELDNGSATDISGVVIKGRPDGVHKNQFVTSFKAQYKDSAGAWKDVDSGYIFEGVIQSSQANVFFKAPINTSAIRIYPQTWNNHMSMRAGLMTGGSSSEGYRSRPVEKQIEAFSFY
jgi:hypothetical protein